MTVLALVIKTRFVYSNKKCFRISAFEVVSEVLLQYFEVVHKKFVSHFFNESDLGVWENVISLKFFKFAKVSWAPINMMVGLFGTRRGPMFCGSNTERPFGHANVLFIT